MAVDKNNKINKIETKSVGRRSARARARLAPVRPDLFGGAVLASDWLVYQRSLSDWWEALPGERARCHGSAGRCAALRRDPPVLPPRLSSGPDQGCRDVVPAGCCVPVPRGSRVPVPTGGIASSREALGGG